VTQHTSVGEERGRCPAEKALDGRAVGLFPYIRTYVRKRIFGRCRGAQEPKGLRGGAVAKHHEDVCVVRPAGAPVRFQWRGCGYRVVDILASWVEATPWWHDTGRGAPLQSGQRRVWQVEAVRHPRGAHVGVYELAQETQTGRWWLTRVWD